MLWSILHDKNNFNLIFLDFSLQGGQTIRVVESKF